MTAHRIAVSILTLVGIAAALPASAQSTYVSASVTGDIVRFSGSEVAGLTDTPGSGEAIGFALRVGTPLGAAWGVEAEFARPSEIATESGPDVIPLAERFPAGFPIDTSRLISFPSFTYSLRTTQRVSTVSAAAWARQDFTARLAMVYVGGIGFYRADGEIQFTFEQVQPPIGVPLILRPSVTRSVRYGVGPFAGLEARIGMTEHIDLVPALRLHGLDDGWLIRPAVGLAWNF